MIESDITRMRIDVKLNPQAMRDREVSVQEVRDQVKPTGGEVKVECYSMEIKSKDLEIRQFRRLANKLPGHHIKGIPAWKRVLVLDANGEWMMLTEGCSLAPA